MLYIDDLIGKLIEIRNRLGKLEVCKIGHYGEIYAMSIDDIYVRTASRDVFGAGKETTIVNICTPDIGPEPD